jgi:hypothetical protein
MTTGPTLILQCPYCPQQMKRSTYRSGNDFGATFYSDGTTKGGSLFPFTSLGKCPACSGFFWTWKLSRTGEIAPEDNWFLRNMHLPLQERTPMTERERLPHVKDLELVDLVNIVGTDLIGDSKEEALVRQRIWQGMNNGMKESQFYIPEGERGFYEENLRRFLEIKLMEEESDYLMAAEGYRNLGNFQRCIELLKHVTSDWYQRTSSQIRKTAEEGKRYTIEIV